MKIDKGTRTTKTENQEQDSQTLRDIATLKQPICDSLENIFPKQFSKQSRNWLRCYRRFSALGSYSQHTQHHTAVTWSPSGGGAERGPAARV